MKRKLMIASTIFLSVLFLLVGIKYAAGGFGGGGGSQNISGPTVEITAEDVATLEGGAQIQVKNEGDRALRLLSGTNAFLDIKPTNVNGRFQTVFDTVNNRDIIFAGNGNVGIGTNAPSTWGGFAPVVAVKGAYPTYVLEGSRKWGMGVLSSGYFDIYDATAGANRVVIDSNGNVGIGTVSPGANQLDISSSQGIANSAAIRALYPGGGGLLNTEFAALAHRGGAWTAIYAKQGAASSAAYFDGNVGIGTNNPQAKLEVMGNAIIGIPNSNQTSLVVFGSARALSWDRLSDNRLKNNITRMNNALDKVQKLEGVTFNWNANGQPDVGFVAQNVETVLPEIVSTGSDGYKSLDSSKISAVLVEAVKEQQKQIAELKIENENLKQRIDAIEKK